MKEWLKQQYTKLCRYRLREQSLQRQLCYLYSFPHNNNGWLDTFVEKASFPVYIAYTPAVAEEVKQFCMRHPKVTALPLRPGLMFFNQTLTVIGQSRWLLCDNYFPVLASLTNTEQRVGMIWHANGAIKQFGACDPKNNERSAQDVERLHAVYHRYTDYFIPSQAMGEVFEVSYLADASKLRPTGFPRTDALYQLDVKAIKEAFFNQYPQYRGKQLVLYAPTYREDQAASYPFDKEHVERAGNYAVICRYHPHSNQVSDLQEVDYQTLLAVVDYCITDYSSLPFDYTLMHETGHLIFYQYDREQYKARFGLEPLFLEYLPGPVAMTMEEVVAALNEPAQSYAVFNEKWNTYNHGQATENILAFIEEDLA